VKEQQGEKKRLNNIAKEEVQTIIPHLSKEKRKREKQEEVCVCVEEMEKNKFIICILSLVMK
jgi:hypothetical protein